MGISARCAADVVTVALRPATGADLDAIVEIERMSFSDPWSAASFAGLLSGPRVRMTVADDDGQVVGYSVLLLVPPDSDLANFAVVPRARRRGTGRLLLAGVLSQARAENVRHVYLEVRKSNAAAIALYERAGFQQCGVRRRYYREPVEDARVLRLDIVSE
jgi:ribosomal-protein-alanine N-acetyltransferase